jgi:hypothetical protein
MAYTNPRTWADETVVNSDDLNTEIRDNVSALYSMANAPYRNLLYNGAMQVAQRSSSIASITGGGYYTADRWYTNIGSAGTWTQSVVAEAPTASGFQKSLKMLCTTASASLAAGANLDVYQALEGQDLIRVMKGSENAKTLTLSFWVRSNVTGTYVAWLADMNNTRSVGATYTVSASGVWELKTITFPADATGALNNDNGASLRVRFHLVAGSTYTSGTLNTTWASTVNANTAPGQTNLAAAINNYWQVTGVQLETGPIATPFEFLPFGDELARCQRYYQRYIDPPMRGWAGSDTRPNNMALLLPVAMRSSPTVSTSGTLNITDGGNTGNVTSIFAQSNTVYSASVTFNLSAGLTVNRPAAMYPFGNGVVEISAEL